MSQLDLIAQLRGARPVVPTELRELVASIAAQAAPEPRPRRGFTWRRAAFVAVPALALAIGAAALIPFGGNEQGAPEQAISYPAGVAQARGAAAQQSTAFAKAPSTSDGAIPATSPRIQRVTMSLSLRVRNGDAVSEGTKQAVAIARSLGGYPSALNVDTAQRTGYANLVLRVPKQNVQKAVDRLSALGTIIAENVAIKDIQNQVDATTRKIERLVAQRAAWEQQAQTTQTQAHIAALTDQIGKLRRGRNATVRNASFATVRLDLTTREAPAPVNHGNGPFHNLAVAFRMIGIGAVYALALGAPFLILFGLAWLGVRAVRRHRENALLSRS